jgi:hypothetical protein
LKSVEGFPSRCLQRGKCSHIYTLPDIAVILSPRGLSRGRFSWANRQENLRGRYSKLWVRLVSLCTSIKSIFKIGGTLFTVCLERKSKHISVPNFEVLELFMELLS